MTPITFINYYIISKSFIRKFILAFNIPNNEESIELCQDQGLDCVVIGKKYV